MKKAVSLVLFFALAVSLFSCTVSKKLYGAWYVDEGSTRNAIQFSQNAEGKDVFIWAVYDISEDKIETNHTGFYKISGDTIIFDYGEGSEALVLNFTLSDGTLNLYNETASMVLEKYVLE